MVEWLEEQWKALKTNEVWGLWKESFPIISGLTKETGIFEDEQLLIKLTWLLDTIGAKFGHDFKRMLNINATDANTGTFSRFTEKTNTFDDFAEISVASSSLPGIFPSTKWFDKVFIDGGVIYGADLSSAV
jgi:predicted acylesterase/phospholipase RssA